MQQAEWRRAVLAGSGLLLVLFLVLHLGGVVLAVLAPVAFEHYAVGLHTAAWLPLAELALLAVALSHTALSLAKVWANRRAGNTAALSSRRGDPIGALAARSQAAGGVLLLSFVVVHLAQLRWPRPGPGLEGAVLRAVLHHPASLALYVAGGLAAGLHLLQGGEAAQRSLGLLTPANGVAIRRVSRGLAWVVGGGFGLVALLLAGPLGSGMQP